MRCGLFPLTSLAFLAGCGGMDKPQASQVPGDAAVIDALAGPIMTDADLAALNDDNAAITVGGPIDSALPPIDRGRDAVVSAREAAARLVGGKVPLLPDGTSEDLAPLRAAVTAAQMAVAADVAPAACAAGVRYTARWAAALPPPLQVYPRGAVEEAAGNDTAGCALRVVHFRTPVAVADVTAFYYARLRASGWPSSHGVDGDEHLLRGRSGGTGYIVYVRKAPDGLTAADIVLGG